MPVFALGLDIFAEMSNKINIIFIFLTGGVLKLGDLKVLSSIVTDKMNDKAMPICKLNVKEYEEFIQKIYDKKTVMGVKFEIETIKQKW